MLRIHARVLAAILVTASLFGTNTPTLADSVPELGKASGLDNTSDDTRSRPRRSLVLTRQQLYGDKFYDVICERVLGNRENAKETAVWFAALELESKRSDLADWQKQLVELRHHLLQSVFPDLTSSMSSEDLDAASEIAAKSVGGDVSFTACPPHGVIELSVAPVLFARERPASVSYDQWQSRFLRHISQHRAWLPSCKSTFYQLASDVALSASRYHDATKWAILAETLADADSHSVLRRTSRERLLQALQQIGRSDCELAQLAAFQIVARERIPVGARQLAESVLSLSGLGQVDHAGTKMLGRRISIAGPGFTMANGKKVTDKNYCLCVLHTVAQPGPLLVSRKRMTLFAESLKVARELEDNELATRLRVYRKNALLQHARFDEVLDGASQLAVEIEELNNVSLGLQLAFAAWIASEQTRTSERRPASVNPWEEQVDQLVTAFIASGESFSVSGKQTDSRWSPGRVLSSLATSNMKKRVGKTDFKPFVSREFEPDPGLAQAELNDSGPNPELSPAAVRPGIVPLAEGLYLPAKGRSGWFWIATGVGSLAALVGLVWIANLRRSLIRRPELPRHAATLESMNLDAESRSLAGSGEVGSKVCPMASESLVQNLVAPAENESALADAPEVFHLRGLLESVVSHFAGRQTKQVGLASDPGRELDRTLRGDASKISLLLASLAKEMARCPLIGRVMLSGRVEESAVGAESILEVSLTYHLPEESTDSVSGRKLHNSRWIENPTAARLVALLGCDIDHNLDPSGIGCLVARIKVATASEHCDASVIGLGLPRNSKKLLVVDPDELVLTSLKAACQVLGQDCEVTPCWTSEVAQQCRDGEYAAVLVDQSLLVGRVAEYAWRQVRNSDPGLLLIALQTDDLLEVPQTVDQVISKPVSLTELTRVITQARAAETTQFAG